MTPRSAFALALLLQTAVTLSRPSAAVSAGPGGPSGPTAPAAPQRLIDTGLYANGRVGEVDPANRPFAPQYPLWTDGAAKSRWIFLPEGSTIDASNAADWEFPVGTRFWKEFRFAGRAVETRFIWRAAGDSWVFASYLWNAEGTDAVLAPENGVTGAAALGPGRSHTVPAVSDCRACHGDTRVEPLGFNALQLSEARDPAALHAEPIEDGMWTVRALQTEGRLRTGAGGDPVVDDLRISGNAVTRAVVGYLSTNCGSCHRAGTGVVLLGTSLKHSDVLDGDQTRRAMLDYPTRWQIPGAADGTTRLIDRHAAENSALLRRMRSRQPSSQMPPLGTVLADESAVAAVQQWLAQQ